MEINDHKENNYPNSRNLLIWGLIIFVITTLIVIFIPLIVTTNSWFSLGVVKPNEIGDTIGGILGPCVGLIAAALTFLAFWAQYDANIEQRKQFDQSLSNERAARLEEKDRIKNEQEVQNVEFQEKQKQFDSTQKLQQEQILLQDKRSRINLFETRFYTMLSIHRDNSINIEVNGYKGRKVFSYMMDELKLLYCIFVAICDDNKAKVAKLDNVNIYNIAYLSFFFGIGEKTTPLVKNLVHNSLVDFVEKSHNIILSQIELQKVKKPEFIIIDINNNQFKWNNVNYNLGTGHLRRLSHYVRHLFQIVKFVDDQPNDLIKQEDKYSYISNLRAQLSVDEQLLLYYNAISVLGMPWIDITGARVENYIERYCMLKSMPVNAADFYKKPTDFFKEQNLAGKSMFEWTEIKQRLDDLIKG